MADQRYLVTARKYRPTLFRDVVAQQHVTDTLKNALRLDRLAHAYLFSGPRGVGKTTTARILAKAINCETPREEREDASEPCCACDSCRSFEDGRSMNVFEMDAASNNKVDDIRELRETVRIPPQGNQKKVYILDEVHMLSTQAFNALLKTLEEPPPHALFIFATTEPHKVLPTILSRCQRFDFRRIPVPEMVDHLRAICDQEDIEADEESLMLLARKGEGALRDALSAFDQAISLCGTTLKYGDLTQALGVVDQDLFFELTGYVAAQNTAGVLQLVHDIVRNGYDLQEFLAGLAEHLRNVLVARSLGQDALEEVAEATRARYAEEADRFGEADLLRLLTIAGDAEDDVKNSTQPRLKMELALLKMAKLRRVADLRRVIEKIDRLEQMVEDGTLPERLPSSTDPRPNDVEHPNDERPNDERPASQVAEASTTYDASPDPSTEPAPSPSPSPSPTSDASTHRGASSDATADAAPDSPTAEAPAASDTSEATTETTTETTSDAETSPPDAADADWDDDADAFDEDPFGADDEASDDGAIDDGPTDDVVDEEALDDDVPGVSPSMEDASSAAGDDSDDGPTGRGSGDASDDTGVGYGDLFGSPALKKKSSSEEAAGGASGDASGANEGANHGDGQASDGPAAEATVVAEPGGSAQAAGNGAADEAVATAPDARVLERVWDDFIDAVTNERISVGMLLREAHPVNVQNGTVTIGVPRALHRDQLRNATSTLRTHLTSRIDDDVETIQFVVRATETETDDATDDAMMTPGEKLDQLRSTYPVLDVLYSQFGAEPVFS